MGDRVSQGDGRRRYNEEVPPEILAERLGMFVHAYTLCPSSSARACFVWSCVFFCFLYLCFFFMVRFFFVLFISRFLLDFFLNNTVILLLVSCFKHAPPLSPPSLPTSPPCPPLSVCLSSSLSLSPPHFLPCPPFCLPVPPPVPPPFSSGKSEFRIDGDPCGS